MNITYKYGDKKPKRMWINCFVETEYSEKDECVLGYSMSIEIGLNKGEHTYIKGVWCYHTSKKGLPYDWNIAIETYGINFNQYLNDALKFAIENGYCK